MEQVSKRYKLINTAYKTDLYQPDSAWTKYLQLNTQHKREKPLNRLYPLRIVKEISIQWTG